MRLFTILVSLHFLSFGVVPAYAWNDVGHMIVARIAYERLTDGERAAVVDILRYHPHLRELLLKDRPAHATQDEWIFLRAAIWPDQVRPPREHIREPVRSHPVYRFHHPAWHYANFEYRSGQYATLLPDKPLRSHSSAATHEEATNIIEQLDHSYLILRGKQREVSEPEIEFAPAEIRAIRMCWLMHLMGDVHQPLHVTSMVDRQIPALQHGDDGGNKIAIRVHHDSAPKKLHAVWDDLLGTNSHFEKVIQFAERLTHDPRLAASRLPEFTYRRYSWEFAEESYQAAKEIVYQNGRLNFTLVSSVESKEVPREAVPVLSQSALDQAYTLAERRATLAGYRLAERLRFIVQHDAHSVELIGTIDTPSKRVVPSRHLVR